MKNCIAPTKIHLCVCRSNGCGLLEYTSKDGSKKPGVEVSSRTLKSHRLQDWEADLREKKTKSQAQDLGRENNEEELDESRKTSELIQMIQSRLVISQKAEDTGTSTLPSSVDSINEVSEEHEPGLGIEYMTDSDAIQYHCSHFYDREWTRLHPVVLNSVLVSSMMTILEHNSLSTASWLLASQRHSVTLVAKFGLGVMATEPRKLDRAEERVVEAIPRNIQTAIGKLEINPVIKTVNCCKSCFATYDVMHTPKNCVHSCFEVDELGPRLPPVTGVCGEPLLKVSKDGKTIKPIRQYAYQSLAEWIARLLARPGIEQQLDRALEESCRPFDPEAPVQDIHGSSAWRSFKGTDGHQFTAKTGNLMFGLFVDGINPYGNKSAGKHASITFIVMVCLNLPWVIRNLPENIFLVGIAPGPREPKVDQINWILKPIVEQLNQLWSPGIRLSKTADHPNGRVIKAGLLAFFADLPALRRTLGFSGVGHTFFCSFCYLKKKDINNLDSETWDCRTAEDHQYWSQKWKMAESDAEREDILKKKGLRYSVLSELEYWNVIKYQTVDSMHNLLLGILHWHCREAWSMEEVDDPDVHEEETADLKIPPKEVKDINSDAARIARESFDPSLNHAGGSSNEDEGIGFLDMSFGSQTGSSDEEYVPPSHLEDDAGWNGTWTQPAIDKIIMDGNLLKYINQMLPRIHVPSWIKQPISVLGKASFGKLKADEWRSLFTIQLVLVLVPKWSHGAENLSLLQNFAHLVSLVNLALKRSITSAQIARYQEHLKTYLESTKILFDHVGLRPNHHMAFHLAECMRKFGPVRAWWSFPMERLMGKVLKACHNNHLGEIEITFLKNFCQGANLHALLKSEEIPEALKGTVEELLSAYEGQTHIPLNTDSLGRLSTLGFLEYKLLVEKLNENRADTSEWLSADAWCERDDRRYFGSVSSQCEQMKQINIGDVCYAVSSRNPNNSVIAFRNTGVDLGMCFGQIQSIFSHHRVSPRGVSTAETFMAVKTFSEIEGENIDCFKKLNVPDIQGHLFFESPSTLRLVRLSQVVAHCAWVIYKAREFHPSISRVTIALVNLDRS